jgi:hypothetical protein
MAFGIGNQTLNIIYFSCITLLYNNPYYKVRAVIE